MCTTLTEVLSKYDILSKEDIKKVVKSAVERSYKKGAYFLKASARNTELGFLLAGVFRYYIVDAKGVENTFMFITEGDFFTEFDSFHKKNVAESYFQAETDASILVFSHQTYQRILSEIPGMESVFKRISQDNLTKQLKISRSFLNLDAKEAYQLLLENIPSLVGRVPDNHLASYMGITKSSLSRIKKNINIT